MLFSTIVILTLMVTTFALPQTVIASPTVGFSDNGILVEEWHFDMGWYTWGRFGSSPAIADLGPDVNDFGTDSNKNLEIVTGSDEWLGPGESNGVWRCFDTAGNLEWERGTWSDEARSSPAIVDLDGDLDLEIVGGTTSGLYVQVMDHQGNFVWTFPTLLDEVYGGEYFWPSSPAVADLDTAVDGLEVVIGNRWRGEVWCFDGDNSDGVNDGHPTIGSDFPWGLGPLGDEGNEWDVLWIFDVGITGPYWAASPAVGDVDADGDLEVVIGAPGGNLYVLNGADGSLERSFEIGAGIVASAAIADLDADPYLEIVIGAFNGDVYCFEWDGSSGRTEWTFPTMGPALSSAAIGDIDADGSLEIVVGSNDGNVYAIDASGTEEWHYTTGGRVVSSPALASKDITPYAIEWPMFRHDAMRTGYYGPSNKELEVYVGSDDGYLYLLNGALGFMIDRFEVNKGYWLEPDIGEVAIHTSPSVADVDGDRKLEIFFYDWGDESALGGHTFWALETRYIDKVTGGGWFISELTNVPYLTIYQPWMDGPIMVRPIVRDDLSAVDFYDYSSASGHTPFMEYQVSKIYLYRNAEDGELSLIMHHSMDESDAGIMRVDFRFEGVPAGASTAWSDDPNHLWNNTDPARPDGREFDLTLRPEGNWKHSENSDGGVIGDLPTDEPWCMTVYPEFNPEWDTDNWDTEILAWKYQGPGEGNVIDLNMDEPLTICAQPAVIGHECHFGIVGIPVEGGWKGQGSFVDKDYRLKAHLTVDDGSSGTSVINGHPYVILTGTARLSINNEQHGDVDFRVFLVDVPTGEDRFFIRFFGHNVYTAFSGPGGINGEIVIH